ncbi:MAG TPA: O-antigen ligase family protein, partial [Tepidisphaeraceae bacterium]
MAKSAAKSAKSARHTAGQENLAPEASPWRVLTRTAFVLMIALVVVRATIFESLRNELQVVPGTVGAPATPGPATGLTLDLFFCIPAMLILARRLVDVSYRIRCGRAHLAMFLLAGWTLLSALWAPDKFIAAIAAAHWAAAIVLLWAASQLVYQWRHMRIVAGVSFGLLLILLVQGYYYRFVDLPDLRHEWEKDRAGLLNQRGTEDRSFEARQIEMNVLSGEVAGFSLSRNTYAALLVLLGIISAGVAVQRIADRDSLGWSVPIFVVLAFAMLMLYRYVESKTAYATPFIGAILLTIIGKRRQWIAAHARRLYFGGITCFLLGVAAVVGHGLKHGTLFQLSLTYRWQYWVGAARLFIHHPWLGVGWANFGNSYLAFRLPQAIEQPKDPHNFLVRAFVELGVLGGALMIAWMLRLWWEFTQPALEMVNSPSPKPNDSDHRHTMFLLIGLPIFAIAISALVAIDWNQRYEWVILELFKRAMFLLALLVGMGIVALRSFADQRLDNRPAPWILWSILVALGLFLIHNLIDFSLFEPGPLFLFALLAGSALGMRLPECKGRDAGMPVLLGSFIFAGVVWLVAAAAGAWNVG